MRRLNQTTALLFMVILIMMLCGCQTKSEYSFENPDIFAYINGEPVYESQMKPYIEMKKAYYADILNSIQDNTDDSAAESDPYSEMLNKTYEIELERMKTVVSFTDEGWEKDYLRTFLINKKLNDFVAGKKDSFKEFIKSTVETAVQEALNSKGIEINYYNVASLNVEAVINNVGDKLNLSYEDCAETVYADFVKNEFLYQYLINYFTEKEFMGEKVEWNGSNVNDYTDYFSDVYSQYEDYLSELLDSAEIVKRQ